MRSISQIRRRRIVLPGSLRFQIAIDKTNYVIFQSELIRLIASFASFCPRRLSRIKPHCQK
jgi:hypothetical protein